MKVLQIILLIVFSVGATVSYADPPASKGKTFSSKIQKTVPQKSSNTVSLSFSLFQKLMNMKSAAVAQYLKQQGCKVEQSGDGIYEAKVKGGTVYIFYPSYHSPRIGIGPVEFCTGDLKVCYSWYDALRNAEYGVYSNDGLWSKERNVSAYPIFGVLNTFGTGREDDDYAQSCTLYVKAYPQ